MKTQQIKKILKPLIKECIKEVMFEDGTLSTIISEVLKGATPQNVVYEAKVPSQIEATQKASQRRNLKLQEQKRQILDAIGREAYNGVDLFEGTTPTKATKEATMSPQGSSPLDGVDPSDAGVDISSFGTNSQIWKKLAGK